MYEYFAYIRICTPCTHGAQRWASDFLELELQMVMGQELNPGPLYKFS